MQEFIIKISIERFEIIEAVDKINDELYDKYNKKDKLDYLPVLSYSFGQNYSAITLSIASENDLPEFSIWFSEKDDRIFYEKSDKYESFYKFIKRKWLIIKDELNNIKL